MMSLRNALRFGSADGTPKSNGSRADSGVSPSSTEALPRGMPSVNWQPSCSQKSTPFSQMDDNTAGRGRDDSAQRCVASSSRQSIDRAHLPGSLEVTYHLSVLEKPRISSTAFRSITAQTLAALIQRVGWKEFCAKYIVVDCRYPYEYNGGHIKCAVNVHDKEQLTPHFFPTHDRIPIFHCEFSHKRGPDMAYALRAYDRQLNKDRYPDVHYKEIYLLEGGYKGFFAEFHGHDMCEPNAYVTMLSDPVQLARYKNHLKRSQQTAPKSRLGTVVHKIKRLGAARRLNFSGSRSPVETKKTTPSACAASRKRTSSTRRSDESTPSGTKGLMRPLTHWYPVKKHARGSRPDREQTPIAFRKRLPEEDHQKTPVCALKRHISKPIVQFPASSDEEELYNIANPLPAMCRLSFD